MPRRFCVYDILVNHFNICFSKHSNLFPFQVLYYLTVQILLQQVMYFIVWNLISDRFFLWLKTTEFCFISPDPYSGSGYETSIHQYAFNVLGLEIFSTQVLSYLLI